VSDQRPVVVVQQSQSQTQTGCCAGAGCGWLLLAAIVITLLGAVVDAMSGTYGLGWQIAAWVGVPILILLILGMTFVALDQKFGWGITDPPSETPDTPQAHTRTPEDVLGDEAENYGIWQPRQREGSTGAQDRPEQRRPHPDDPRRPPEGMPTETPSEGETQTEYAVVLQDAGPKKIRVIKAVRAATDLGLREAKDLVDGAPNIIKEDLPLQEAEALKAELEGAGARVELW
jgi:hypothetical protein